MHPYKTIFKPKVLADLPNDTKILSVNIHADDIYGVTRRKFPEFRGIECLDIEAPASDLLFVLKTLNPNTLHELSFSLPFFSNNTLPANFESEIVAALETFINLKSLTTTAVPLDKLKSISKLVELKTHCSTISKATVHFLARQNELSLLNLSVDEYQGVDLSSLKNLTHLQKVIFQSSSKEALKAIRSEFRRIEWLIPVTHEGILFSSKADREFPEVFGVVPKGMSSLAAIEPKNEDIITIFSANDAELFSGTIDDLCPRGIKPPHVLDWFEKQLRSSVKTWKPRPGMIIEPHH